ncbi:hypothetical protein ACSQ67_006913 [Phaseolus vulgaris]
MQINASLPIHPITTLILFSLSNNNVVIGTKSETFAACHTVRQPLWHVHAHCPDIQAQPSFKFCFDSFLAPVFYASCLCCCYPPSVVWCGVVSESALGSRSVVVIQLGKELKLLCGR